MYSSKMVKTIRSNRSKGKIDPPFPFLRGFIFALRADDHQEIISDHCLESSRFRIHFWRIDISNFWIHDQLHIEFHVFYLLLSSDMNHLLFTPKSPKQQSIKLVTMEFLLSERPHLGQLPHLSTRVLLILLPKFPLFLLRILLQSYIQPNLWRIISNFLHSFIIKPNIQFQILRHLYFL